MHHDRKLKTYKTPPTVNALRLSRRTGLAFQTFYCTKCKGWHIRKAR